MAKLLFILIGILPNVLIGQYTYFNQGYLPPYPEIGSGESIHLFLNGDTLITYGLAPSPDDDGEGFDYLRFNYYLSPWGEIIQLNDFSLDDEFINIDFSDNISESDFGYVAPSGNGQFPLLFWYDADFSLIQQVDLNFIESDTTFGSLFQTCITEDHDVLSAGRIVYDLEPDVPGQNTSNLILTKHSSSGELVWIKEYDQESLSIGGDYGGFFVFPRGGIFELNTGEILLFCTIGVDLDCFAIKFTSEGEYIDHVKWGNPNYGEGSPWPVQISDSTFKFVFGSHSTGMGEVLASHPIVGTLNANDMTVSLFPVIDHDYYYGLITDFERTPDGGYAILFYGEPDTNGEEYGYAWIVKLDEDGNEEWFHQYTPPEPYDSQTAYDLEITSDGGFAFVGNYHPQTDDVYYYKTWVVKTDACGELIDTGCPPTIGTDDLLAHPEPLLTVFPNPSNRLLHVTSSVAGIAQAALVDMTGRCVWKTNTNLYDLAFTWNIEAVPPSLYELFLFDAHGLRIASTPVIKN